MHALLCFVNVKRLKETRLNYTARFGREKTLPVVSAEANFTHPLLHHSGDMSSSLQTSLDVPVDAVFMQQIENWMQEISRYDSSPEGHTTAT